MIERTTSGLMDYCMARVEEVDARTDIDIDKKVKYGLAYIKEVRGLAGLELQYKKLAMMAPDVARDRNNVLPIGSKPKAVEQQPQTEAKPETEAKPAPQDSVANVG